MTIKRSFVFALVVTLAMQTLDIVAHFLTGHAVHLGYIAVKMAVIFYTLFLYTAWMGTGRKHAILSGLTGTVIFDFYYRFAHPTLDRTVFVLDEKSITWIIAHLIFLLIPYFLTLWLMEKETAHSNCPTLTKNRLTFIIFATLIITTVFVFPKDGIIGGLSYNDHIFVGTIAFITSVVGFYKLVKNLHI